MAARSASAPSAADDLAHAPQPRRGGETTHSLLDALPNEVWTEVISPLPTRDIGRVDQVCHAFHSAAEDGAVSVVEQALRRRAAAGGHAVPADLGFEKSMKQLLMWLERKRAWPKARVADCSFQNTVFVNLHGSVLMCGIEAEHLGVLGHGPHTGPGYKFIQVPSPVPALRGVRVVSVAAGDGHVLALAETGQVYSWGVGSDKQLGFACVDHQHTPQLVWTLLDVRVLGVAAGHRHSLAHADDGRLFEWGEGTLPLQPEALQTENVVDVAAGYKFSLAVSDTGRLYSWSYGGGAYGKLGHGNSARQITPKRIEALEGVRITGVAAGSSEGLAVTEEGHVYSWGYGGGGRLGHGDEVDRFTPKVVEALLPDRGGETIARIATKGACLAVSHAGNLYSWGYGYGGVLGHGDWNNHLLPKRVDAFTLDVERVVAAASCSLLSVAVTNEGNAYRWGLPLFLHAPTMGFAHPYYCVPRLARNVQL